MTTKNKTKKNQTKSERTVGKKVAPMNQAIKKKLGKWVTPKKKLPKKKTAPKKTEVKTKAGGKKTTGGKTAGAPKKQVQGKSQSVGTVAFALERLGARPGEQSGDLQGLSNVQRADSESVDELLELRNAFTVHTFCVRSEKGRHRCTPIKSFKHGARTLLHPVAGLSRIALVVTDFKGIRTGE